MARQPEAVGDITERFRMAVTTLGGFLQDVIPADSEHPSIFAVDLQARTMEEDMDAIGKSLATVLDRDLIAYPDRWAWAILFMRSQENASLFGGWIGRENQWIDGALVDGVGDVTDDEWQMLHDAFPWPAAMMRSATAISGCWTTTTGRASNDFTYSGSRY